MQSKLAENIRALRKEHKMTQEQLAEMMQVSTGAVHKWEANLSIPDIKYIMAMAEFFSVSTDALIGFSLSSNIKYESVERIKQLLTERRLDEAKEEAKMLLRKYPNDFSVLFNCGCLYKMLGIEQDDRKSALYAIDLFERAITCISQNTDPDISEMTIISDISECYLTVGKADKAIDILKKNNSDGRHNVSIGMIYANLLHSPKDAEYYLTRAFSDFLTSAFNIMISYSYVYLDKGDDEMSFRTLNWLVAFSESLRQNKERTIYIDKINAVLYALIATLPQVVNENTKLREVLTRAYDFAVRFDSDPVYSSEGILFCENFDKLMTLYDSLGKTAFSAVERILFDEDMPEEAFAAVTSIWKEIKNENEKK